MSENSNASNLPLRPALRPESIHGDEHGPAKVVSIAEEPEEYTPLERTPSAEETSRRKQFTASIAKRMTGRPNLSAANSSRISIVSQGSTDGEPSHSPDVSTNTTPQHRAEKHGHHSLHYRDKLLSQVAEWLQAEKAKRAAKKTHKGSKDHGLDRQEMGTNIPASRSRTSSQSSDSSAISLEKLQRILEDNMTAFGHEHLPATSPSLGPKRLSHSSRRRPSARSLKGSYSSDTEYQDGDVVVPTCDVVLDNSKTMSYTGGSSMETPTLSSSSRIEKEKKCWLVFKYEIVRLAHTLRLKGWRKVPLENGGDIEVERLSGALTNAVYVVSPPKNLPALNSGAAQKPPPKLLLRIYGPQVEHLIDRENELNVLKRLARKRIGPRLLGTFKNGRFEEFLNAQALTAEDLRVQGTSKQIAKRMRELHDGIELLPREREEGPFVWRNWDKWVDRVEETVQYLDKQIATDAKVDGERWIKKGYVCGVEWHVFKAAIEKYRNWLDEYYGGHKNLMNKLVFAHNDTQYGNILRLIPESIKGSAPSPLLLPQNTHKQLVVIDFEYASANTPGLEFANHFTEWCYNYHDPTRPYACNTSAYPTITEQETFIRSYVNHRPQFNPRASATPKLSSSDSFVGGPGSISAFMLDSRTPSGTEVPTKNVYAEEEARRELEMEKQVKELMNETRVWRIANSAQWVAWGIVQAKIPELNPNPPSQEDSQPTSEDTTSQPIASPNPENHQGKRPEGLVAEALLHDASTKDVEAIQDGVADGETGEEEEEFDYLAYAQERAFFFWGDIVGLGIMKESELPEGLIANLKRVDY